MAPIFCNVTMEYYEIYRTVLIPIIIIIIIIIIQHLYSAIMSYADNRGANDLE